MDLLCLVAKVSISISVSSMTKKDNELHIAFSSADVQVGSASPLRNFAPPHPRVEDLECSTRKLKRDGS